MGLFWTSGLAGSWQQAGCCLHACCSFPLNHTHHHHTLKSPTTWRDRLPVLLWAGHSTLPASLSLQPLLPTYTLPITVGSRKPVPHYTRLRRACATTPGRPACSRRACPICNMVAGVDVPSAPFLAPTLQLSPGILCSHSCLLCACTFSLHALHFLLLLLLPPFPVPFLLFLPNAPASFSMLFISFSLCLFCFYCHSFCRALFLWLKHSFLLSTAAIACVILQRAFLH